MSLLSSRDETRGARPTLALPERITAFDGYGTGRHHDLVVVLQGAECGMWLAGIEAKADEPLGAMVISEYEHVRDRQKQGLETNKADRIHDLVRGLFGRSLDDDPRLGQLRYQLLTAAAGTLVEAQNRKAVAGLLVIHELARARSDGISQTQLAVSDFLGALAGEQGLFTGVGVLHGPFAVPGGGRIPAQVPLYVALIRPTPLAQVCE